MTPEQRIEYARAVWGTYCHQGKLNDAPMTSLDYHVIATYMDRDIPLAVVLQAINQCAKVGRGIAYVKGAIDEKVTRWAQALPSREPLLWEEKL